MASQALALSSPELLAEYIHESRLRGFFEKRMAAPPDHMAMLIRNGLIVDTYKGAHFSIGGILKSLKALVTGPNHVSILLADLKPFSLQTSFNAVSKDNVPVSALATIEIQINPDRPQNVMGLVNTTGCLSQTDVLSRFKPHLTDRVVEATLRAIPADQIRGQVGLQDRIQAEIMRAIQSVAGDLGLLVRAVSMEWGLNEVEKQAIDKSVLDRQQQQLDQQLNYYQQQVHRNLESRTVEIRSDLDLATLENASDQDLQLIVLNSNVKITDARSAAQRRQEMEALGHQIHFLRETRIGNFENQIAESDHSIDQTKRKIDLQRLQLQSDHLDNVHQSEMRKLDAFTEIEISQRQSDQDLDRESKARIQQIEYVKSLQDLESSADDAAANRRIEQLQLEARIQSEQTAADSVARVAQLNAGAVMTPEQILAIGASQSSDAAAVLMEQAKGNATGNDQVQSLMREMVDQANRASAENQSQAKEMFKMAMDGTVGVASGSSIANGTSGRRERAGAETSLCGGCGRENGIQNRCCIGCGKQLRN